MQLVRNNIIPCLASRFQLDENLQRLWTERRKNKKKIARLQDSTKDQAQELFQGSSRSYSKGTLSSFSYLVLLFSFSRIDYWVDSFRKARSHSNSCRSTTTTTRAAASFHGIRFRDLPAFRARINSIRANSFKFSTSHAATIEFTVVSRTRCFFLLFLPRHCNSFFDPASSWSISSHRRVWSPQLHILSSLTATTATATTISPYFPSNPNLPSSVNQLWLWFGWASETTDMYCRLNQRNEDERFFEQLISAKERVVPRCNSSFSFVLTWVGNKVLLH